MDRDWNNRCISDLKKINKLSVSFATYDSFAMPVSPGNGARHLKNNEFFIINLAAVWGKAIVIAALRITTDSIIQRKDHE